MHAKLPSMQIVQHKVAIDWPLLISTVPLENGANKIVTAQQQINKFIRAN